MLSGLKKEEWINVVIQTLKLCNRLGALTARVPDRLPRGNGGPDPISYSWVSSGTQTCSWDPVHRVPEGYGHIRAAGKATVLQKGQNSN